MKVSINKAARLTGKSTSTIHKAVNDGRMSSESEVSKGGKKTVKIDTSELFRVFPREEQIDVEEYIAEDLKRQASESVENRFLKQENESLRQQLQKYEQREEFLQDQLKEQSQMVKQLTDQRQPETPPSPSGWSWLPWVKTP